MTGKIGARSLELGVWLLAVLAPISELPAQSSAVVDEATMMITRKGAPIGRESFRIVRTPGANGQVFRAVATSALGEARLSSTVATDSMAVPVFYELRVFHRNEQQQFLQGRG